MPHRISRQSTARALRLAELGVAVPQVMGHRLTRMALAGPTLSARDRAEFSGMFAEKNAAFLQSWQAMFAECLRASQAYAMTMARLFSTAWWTVPSTSMASRAATQWQQAMLGVADKGLVPVHRKAVANAKRLSRTRLR